MPAPCRLFARLVLLHSARFFVVLPHHWLLRSLATATTSVAPEVFAIFCLAIQFFWHQRHGVKGGATANVCRLVKSPFPPPVLRPLCLVCHHFPTAHPPTFLLCLIKWLLENAGSRLSPFLFIAPTLNLYCGVAKSVILPRQ